MYQALKLEKTNLSALFHAAKDDAPLFVFAHGAGAPMDHAHMNALANTLSNNNIGSLRFNFPFMEQGKRRVDAQQVCLESIESAIKTARKLCPDRTLYLAGHSFGGRMASHLAAQPALQISGDVSGLVYFSFPLHVSKKPAISRAAHLPDIRAPMLFVSGDRDTLADKPLLENVVDPLSHGTLHWLETADHSFKILKRTRQSTENVYAETGRVVSSWLDDQTR